MISNKTTKRIHTIAWQPFKNSPNTNIRLKAKHWDPKHGHWSGWKLFLKRLFLSHPAKLCLYKICQNKQHLQSPWETSKGKTLVYMYHSHFPPTQGGFKRCKVLNYKKYKLYPGWIMSPELKNIRVYPSAPGKSKPRDALFHKRNIQKIHFGPLFIVFLSIFLS